jgi:hypothetical protein
VIDISHHDVGIPGDDTQRRVLITLHQEFIERSRDDGLSDFVSKVLQK